MENRKYERRQSIYYLRVFDTADNSILGHLVNISESGLMLVCDQQVELNKDYLMRMKLPDAIEGFDNIEFAATSRWCRSDTNSNFFDVGFELVNPGKEFQKILESSIDGYVFGGFH